MYYFSEIWFDQIKTATQYDSIRFKFEQKGKLSLLKLRELFYWNFYFKITVSILSATTALKGLITFQSSIFRWFLLLLGLRSFWNGWEREIQVGGKVGWLVGPDSSPFWSGYKLPTGSFLYHSTGELSPSNSAQSVIKMIKESKLQIFCERGRRWQNKHIASDDQNGEVFDNWKCLLGISSLFFYISLLFSFFLLSPLFLFFSFSLFSFFDNWICGGSGCWTSPSPMHSIPCISPNTSTFLRILGFALYLPTDWLTDWLTATLEFGLKEWLLRLETFYQNLL